MMAPLASPLRAGSPLRDPNPTDPEGAFVQTDAILALCTFALLAGQPASSELVFQPAEGSSLTRQFVYTTEMALDDMSIEVDGEDMTPMIGDVGMEIENTMTYVVTDDFVEVDDGKVIQLQRTFDELAGESEVQVDAAVASESTEATSSSELVGASVLFTWDEDLEEYTVSAAEDGDIEQDLLDGLDMGMDLSGLLPPDDVEEGDQWEVELAGLFGLIMPGGNLAMTPDQGMPELDGFDPEVFSDMIAEYQNRALELMEEWVDGSIDATFAGLREVDGRELAVITLDIDLEIEADLASIAQSAVDALLSQVDIPVPVTVSVDVAQVAGETSGEGELLWDLEGGFGRALELSVDYEMAMDLEISADLDSESHSFGGEFEFSGIGELDVTSE